MTSAMIQSEENPYGDGISDRAKHLRCNFSRSKTCSLHDNEDDSRSFNDNVLAELVTASRPAYKHSPSAPHGQHIPLTKDAYLSCINNKRIQNSKSYDQSEVCDHLRDEGIGTSVSTQRSNSVEDRRRSYKESGYEGSSGQGSSETCASEDVFDPPTERKLSRNLSQVPDLDPLKETEEEVSTDSKSGESSSIKSVLHTTCDKTSILYPQVTPDLEALLRHSESSSEASPSPEISNPQCSQISPQSCVPSFRKLGVSSVVSPTSQSPEKSRTKFDFSNFCNLSSDKDLDDPSAAMMSTIKESDVDFYTLPRDEDQVIGTPTVLLDPEIESLPTPTRVSLYSNPGRSSAGDSEKYTPNIFMRIPSIDVDTSYKTELQIQSIYTKYLSLHRNHELLRVLTSEERPEVIYSFIQRCHSESDSGSSISSRSSLGSFTSQIGSSGVPHTIPSTITECPSDTSLLQSSNDRYREVWKKFYSVEDSSLLSQLRQYSSCQYKGCQESDCILGRGLLRYMEEYMDRKFDSNIPQNTVLKAISEHAGCCDELKCLIPWCNFFVENDYPYEEQVARLQQYYFSGTITTMSKITKEDKFTPLNSKVEIGHKEGVDWHVIARLGSFSNAVLAVTSDLEKPSFIVIKKERKNSLMHREVLHLLKPHPRITKHYWILEQEYYSFYASNFEGVSLAERMGEAGEFSLPVIQALHYLDHLASAAIFLHKSNIAYLNWTVENVILSADQKLVKLCNFSCAVPLKMINDKEDDIEDLKMMLPARIVPPELYLNDVVLEESDIWGLGCIACQMLTGHMIYPELRHDDPVIIRDKFSDPDVRFEPSLSTLSKCQHVKNIIWNCLRTDPRARPGLEELRMEIITAKQTLDQ